MDDQFELPVIYKGEQLHLPARLLQQGYIHRFLIDVNGEEIIFEPDDERNYRALLYPEKADKIKVEIELLKAIAEALASL